MANITFGSNVDWMTNYASKHYVDSQTNTSSDKELLDSIDDSVIENYLRKKKIDRIRKK